MNEFECVTPIFNVKNLAASIDYYINKLGFEKNWDWGTPPTFASVQRGKVHIFLCEGGQGQPGTWIEIFMDDVDSLYEEYKRRGAVIIQPPKNFPWETREMLVEDLDGHRIRMGGKATGPADQDYI